MTVHKSFLVMAMFLLGACTEPMTQFGTTEVGSNPALPESVLAIAAPNQDLASARLHEEDGCFWYRHVGPVETTMLPLRTSDGRPICVKRT